MERMGFDINTSQEPVTVGALDSSFVPWPVMVRNLFKHNGYAGVQVLRTGHAGSELVSETVVDAPSLMHAAIGVMGEVVELKHSATRDNTILELGDILFYMQAGVTVLIDAGLWSNAQQEEMTSYVNEMFDGCGLDELMDHFEFYAAQFLDQAKRVWIYCNPMADHMSNLHHSLAALSTIARLYMLHMGLDSNDVLRANQHKLAKRYPAGVYSNADATNRADED